MSNLALDVFGLDCEEGTLTKLTPQIRPAHYIFGMGVMPKD